jgi:hypothetical protein
VLQDQETLISGAYTTKEHFKVQENINKMKFASLSHYGPG